MIVLNNLFNNMNNFFDKIYVVTCKKFKERHKHIINHFKKFNIEFEFIYGPDSNMLDIKNININPEKKFSKNTMATLFTHYKSWEESIKNNYNSVLICEDDVFLMDYFENELVKFMKQVPNDWDVLQLGWQPFNYNFPNSKLINNNVRKNWSFIGGAHCYALKLNTCIELVNALILKKSDNDYKTDKKLFNKGMINKIVDGYIGDITNSHAKKETLFNLQCYSPVKCLATDCSHNNKFTNIHFKSTYDIN